MNDKYLLSHCRTEKELSDVIKLRYISYRNVEAIEENAEGIFKDKYDPMANSISCMVREGNAPVASVRACIYNKELDFLTLPAFEVYSQEIEKELGLGKKLIEANRFVIHPGKMDAKDLFKIPFRFIILNALKFKCDHIMAAVRPKHVPLYRRVLDMEPISTPKKYPGINVNMILMAGDCAHIKSKVLEREAVFQITQDEINNYLPELNSQQLQLS
jgi:hypothetical protein